MTAKRLGWLAYLMVFLASYAGLEYLTIASLAVGIACHWRFWRVALPLGIVCFVVGFWWGSRG